MEAVIKRSSDGIPQYGGEPELLPAYKEEALQYLMTLEVKKRYLAGPRLAKELNGVAKVAIRTMTTRDPQWLAHPRGTYVLLEFLEGFLAKPSLVEASRYVMKFFYNMRRRRGESMTAWSARHAEALWEASQALRKVQKEYGGASNTTPKTRASYGTSHLGQGWWQDPHHSSRSRTTSRSAASETASALREEVETGVGLGSQETAEDEVEATSDHEANEWWERTSMHSGWGNGWGGWSWSSWAPWTEGSQPSWRSEEYAPPDSWDTSTEIFIPEFLAGFLLLHRAGLDAQERGNILAAIRGEFSTASVSRALREQWSDDEVARRDKQKMNAAYYLNDQEDEENEALEAEEDEEGLEQLDDDAKVAYMAEKEKIDEALASIQMGKATLREARWKQKQLRLGRNFFPPRAMPKTSSSASSQKGGSTGIRCFHCGGPHKVAECPKKGKGSQAQNVEEAAEIAFHSSMVNECAHLGEGGGDPIGSVVSNCYGVIDSGATSSLGSVDALEAVMAKNFATKGDNQVEIDLNKRPTFRFGNGQRKTCLSTAKVGLEVGNKKGAFEVHVHSSPNQPILISRKALRSLGAVIDFSSNKCIFKNVDGRKVLTLAEAENGHLLMPVTGDIMAGATERRSAFKDLEDE